MAIRANPKLITELEIYGAQDVSKCYHCGNCSATCPFSKEPYIFPRRSMRSLQMGLEAKLESDLEPHLQRAHRAPRKDVRLFREGTGRRAVAAVVALGDILGPVDLELSDQFGIGAYGHARSSLDPGEVGGSRLDLAERHAGAAAEAAAACRSARSRREPPTSPGSKEDRAWPYAPIPN